MTSRTQLAIGVLPIQTAAGTPGPAAATCFTPARHQPGPPARLSPSAPRSLYSGPPPDAPISLPARSSRYMATCSTRGISTDGLSHVVQPNSTCSAVHSSPCPFPISSPVPARVQSSPVLLPRSRCYAIYGQVGWMDRWIGLVRDFFSLVLRTPFVPTSLRLALGIISRDDDTGNLRVRKQLAQTGGQLPLTIQSIPGSGEVEAISTSFPLR